jgi:hypothetical protein
MAIAMLSGCGCLMAGPAFQQTQTFMNQILNYFEHTRSAEHTHLLTLELLSRHTSLRQHEETQASIQQQIEKV